MSLFVKLLAGALLVLSAGLSARQGWAMLRGQPAALELLLRLGVGRPGQLALGAAVLLGAALTLLPATFWLAAACRRAASCCCFPCNSRTTAWREQRPRYHFCC